MKWRSKPDKWISLNTCLLLLQDSEEQLGHHLYDEFRPDLGLVLFFSFLSSPIRCTYGFCSLSSHCSSFSAYQGSPCFPYSPEIFITHNCNWQYKSKHSGLVSQSVNCGDINRKKLIKTFSSVLFLHGYSWWVESFSPILQHQFTHLN